MRICLFVALLLCTSCVTNQFAAKHLDRDYTLSEFNGVYVPHKPLNKIQRQVFGNRIVLTDFVAPGTAERLKANYQKLDRTRPAVTVEIVRETESDTLAEATSRFYYLGVNKGPVDLVHYDFDGERNAFERTTTTLTKNLLAHTKAVHVYDRNDKKMRTSDGGLKVKHEMRLFGRILALSHSVVKLDEPWRSVFPPSESDYEGAVSAQFIRVEQPRYDAQLRVHQQTSHRR